MTINFGIAECSAVIAILLATTGVYGQTKVVSANQEIFRTQYWHFELSDIDRLIWWYILSVIPQRIMRYV